MQMERIKFLSDYRMEIELSNRIQIRFDLKPLLATARFKHITSQDFFEQGRLFNQCCIYWDDVTFIYDYEILGEEYIEMYFQKGI